MISIIPIAFFIYYYNISFFQFTVAFINCVIFLFQLEIDIPI